MIQTSQTFNDCNYSSLNNLDLSQSVQNKFGADQVITHPRKISTREEGGLRAIKEDVNFSTRKVLLDDNTRALAVCEHVYLFHVISVQCCHHPCYIIKPTAKATRRV